MCVCVTISNSGTIEHSLLVIPIYTLLFSSPSPAVNKYRAADEVFQKIPSDSVAVINHNWKVKVHYM